MKKKIAILYSGSVTWSGLETYLDGLLSEDFPEIEFFLISMGRWELADKLKEKVETAILSGLRANPALIFKVGKLLKEKNIDVLVSQGVVANFYARLTSLFFRKKHVCIVHSDLVSEYQNPFIKFFYYLTDRGLKNVTGLFICVSEHLKTILLGRGIPERKIKVIYSGVNFGNAPQDVILATARRPESELLNKENDSGPSYAMLRAGKQARMTDKFIIGTLGRLKYEKGYDVLIESVRELDNDTEIRICGEGSERKNLEEIIKKNNLEEKVRLLGHTDDIDKFLGEIDLYIQPSRSEGFGLSIVEAMAKGVPVIVSGNGGLKEIVGQEGIVLKELNPSSLAKAILNVKNNYNILKEKAVRNREIIIEKYDKKRWQSETVRTILEFDKS